ncbi:MAG: rRNA maturation RNase YbeY [Pseudomonadota bacterium]
MTNLTIDVRIDDAAWIEVAPDAEAVVHRALEAAARYLKTGGEAAVLLTDDDVMRTLNAQWRDKDKPTDVLSFPSDDDPMPGAPAFLGDIALGLGTVAKDALALGRPMELHISHLVVHGFLHLLGYDHVEESGAHAMETLEGTILADLGLPDPYGDAA